jgi:hypothetical protein
MVHKSYLVPGISKFIDENILAHYPATSMKRILMAGAVSLYLKQGETLVDTILSNPLITPLGVVKQDGMIDIETIRDILKSEVNKAGFMRLTLPLIGDVDFTPEDVDALYRLIIDASGSTNSLTSALKVPATTVPNGGIY